MDNTHDGIINIFKHSIYRRKFTYIRCYRIIYYWK